MPLGAFKAGLMGVAGVSTGDVVLLSSQTADGDASISFTSGITSTYGEYIFRFYNINPGTDEADITFQVNATDDAGGDYDVSLLTTTQFYLFHSDADAVLFTYDTANDKAQSATFQDLWTDIGSDADESCAGEMHLFNPASTTYVKHFYSRLQGAHPSIAGSPATVDKYTGGYINDTTAIDDIQFKISTGVFDGTIKMWGVK